MDYPNENIKAITEFLFIEEDINAIKKSDLLIILCNNAVKELAEAYDKLYEKEIIGKETDVIISGNCGSLDQNEDKECFRVFDNIKNKNSNFIFEEEATNIYENLLFSKKKLENIDKYTNIIFIGNSFALRRIKLCAVRLGYPIDKIHYVGVTQKEGRNIGKDTWWNNPTSKQRVYAELERIGKYLIKGDLDIE